MIGTIQPQKRMTLRQTLFACLMIIGVGLCLFPFTTAPMALAAGALIALVMGNPLQDKCMKTAQRVLIFSVAGLGAGMNLTEVLRAGAAGMGYTAAGIAAALAMGAGLAYLLRTDRDTSVLVSVGTAICGGSAIAAVAPVIRARQESIAMAFAVVFVLNAAGLLIFPPLGHYFGLTPAQFGLWAALAVHDTSSVVGAAAAYGGDALDHAVVLKMARALWIFPLALLIAYAWPRPREAGEGKLPRMKFPWFIPAFIAVAAFFTFVPHMTAIAGIVEFGARRGMCVTLFLIGSTITIAALKSVGWRPLLLGVLLWFFVAVGSLAVIRAGWIVG